MSKINPELTQRLADQFRESAEFIATNEPPKNIDPVLWEAQRQACLSMADDLDQQVKEAKDA
jgi:hypothetical protein